MITAVSTTKFRIPIRAPVVIPATSMHRENECFNSKQLLSYLKEHHLQYGAGTSSAPS